MNTLRHPLGERFDEALLFAHGIHRHQARKGAGGEIPYLAHVLGVASLVLEYGGTEPQAIAALLHDTLEDAPDDPGHEWVEQEIRRRFGVEVLTMVEDCSDGRGPEKGPWLERKTASVAHVGSASPGSLLVSAADKLHNVRAVLRDYRAVGDVVWTRFKPEAGRAGTLGYYRAMLERLRPRLANAIVTDLDRELTTLEAEAGGRCPWPPASIERRG